MFEEYQEAAQKAEQRKKIIHVMILLSGIFIPLIIAVTQFIH